jgi:mannan endo-1,4-beta-mannosidase
LNDLSRLPLRSLLVAGATCLALACGRGGGAGGAGGAGAVDSGAEGADSASVADAGSVSEASADAAPATPVCFYADSNYSGTSLCVGPGTADFTPSWMGTISSVKVTPGYKAELFANTGLGGRALTLIADQPHLSGCFFNDTVASYRVSIDTPSKFQSVNFLRKISGCNVASGQHNDEKLSPPDAYTNMVYAATMQYPALWSGDFGYSGDTSWRWQVTDTAEAQWSKGAIVHLMFHACPPYLGSSCDWSDITSTFMGDWNDLITDGGTLNTAWKGRLDELVPFFQDLQSKGVEVLFRPLHEMNKPTSSPFWWSGRPGPDGSAKLYQITHDYLVTTKGFTNIAFVWDVQDFGASDDFASYDPGGDYWDMAAVDYYNGGSASEVYGSTVPYDTMLSVAVEKPMAIGETFYLPVSTYEQSMPQMSFFMIWAYGLYTTASGGGSTTNTMAQVVAAYSDPRVIRLSDMPGWK